MHTQNSFIYVIRQNRLASQFHNGLTSFEKGNLLEVNMETINKISLRNHKYVSISVILSVWHWKGY